MKLLRGKKKKKLEIMKALEQIRKMKSKLKKLLIKKMYKKIKRNMKVLKLKDNRIMILIKRTRRNI